MIVNSPIFGFGMPGATEMMVLAFVILLLFGGAKLPTLMRNIGRSANEFKRGMNESDDDDFSGRKDESV